MIKRELSRQKRHKRIKMRMSGSKAKPRLVIKRSINNISAQMVDDSEAKILFALSTTNKEIKQKVATGGNVKAAEIFGGIFAQKAKEKGFLKVVFDRAGYLYHGRVKAFAEAARKGGLEF